MKINASSGPAPTNATRAAARADAGGFSLSETGGAAESAPAAPAAGLGAVSSLDALLALQAVGGPLEGRRKAIRRAGRILDVLDEVKLALLDGAVSPEALERLLTAVRQERGETDDPGLRSVLEEIETRAAVELAKLGSDWAV